MDIETIFNQLKSSINEVDPLGLIDRDIPESLKEYEPEIREITKKDITSLAEEELGNWVYEVFVSFFNEDLISSKDKYMQIANKFLNSMNEINLKIG